MMRSSRVASATPCVRAVAVSKRSQDRREVRPGAKYFLRPRRHPGTTWIPGTLSALSVQSVLAYDYYCGHYMPGKNRSARQCGWTQILLLPSGFMHDTVLGEFPAARCTSPLVRPEGSELWRELQLSI
jgi:hypothetical protein